MTLKCFISHGKADTQLAYDIADALRADTKCDVYTNRGVTQGDTSSSRSDQKLNDADCFVIIVSPAALSDKFVRDQWARIQKRAWQSDEVGMLPVRVDNAHLPSFLSQWQMIDAKGMEAADLTHAVADFIRRLDTRNITPRELHREPVEQAEKRTQRFKGLMKSVTEDDWS